MRALNMKALDRYKELISIIGISLKKKSFFRKGNCFYLKQGNNWGLLDFQKSRESTVDRIIFTVNLGACSGKLLEFFSIDSSQKPAIDACHWRERLGFLLPTRQDKWWVIEANDSIDYLIDELKDYLVKAAIPEIEHHLFDEQLRDEWLTGRSAGLTDIQRLVNLSVLLNTKETMSALREILIELETKSKGKSSAFMVGQHLQRLRCVLSAHDASLSVAHRPGCSGA